MTPAKLPTRSRPRMLVLATGSLLWTSCVATGHHQDPPPPMPHEIGHMGYDEAVQLGTSYAQQLGYSDAELQDASPSGQNLWRVRFGTKRKDEKKVLSLEFDGTNRKLLKSEETGGVGGAFDPPKPSPRPQGGTP